MRIVEKYRPKTLAEIVGQEQPVKMLRGLAEDPQRCCVLCEGSTGTGKSASAYALAYELGCFSGWLDTCYSLNGANLTADTLRHWFDSGESPLRLMAPNGWHVLIIEELEYLNKTCCVLAKDYLDTHRLPPKTIVVATSNDASSLPRAVRKRFNSHLVYSSSYEFAKACYERIAEIWEAECPERDLPSGWGNWGFEGREFSMRDALNELQDAITLELEEVAV